MISVNKNTDAKNMISTTSKAGKTRGRGENLRFGGFVLSPLPLLVSTLSPRGSGGTPLVQAVDKHCSVAATEKLQKAPTPENDNKLFKSIIIKPLKPPTF